MSESIRTVVLASRFEGAERVELLGETTDWRDARSFESLGGGKFRYALALREGVYAYKLKVDGAWALDTANARTRGVGGERNNVLSVGGAPEPVVFAPAPPFLFEEARGGVVVTAALRASGDAAPGACLTLRWAEDDAMPFRSEPMLPVAYEDEHVVFRARIPASASRARFVFELGDGRIVGREEDGSPFVFARAKAADVTPAWWRDAVVYTIFVDRFRPADDHAVWEIDPGPNVAAGGHLDGVRRSLDELLELGIDTVYLTPIHVGASCHRYDLIDPWNIDPSVGGEPAFERLLEALHARRLRLVLDLSFSHAGRGYPPFEDVLLRGPASRWASWFQWTRDGDGDTRLAHYGRRDDAPLFNLDDKEVRAMVCDVAERWARRGVDGFRLDAAAEVPMDLAREVRARLRTVRPDAIVVGELVPRHAWRWRSERAVDAATDFGFHDVATAFVARRTIDAPEARRRLSLLDVAQGATASSSLRFLSTHDHVRFTTLARAAGDPSRSALGLLMLLTFPGVPALLYGEEIGLSAAVAELEPEAAWADRAPMPWTKGARDETRRTLVKRLLAIRRASPALRSGEHEILHAEGSVMVWRRSANGEVIDVTMNVGDAAVHVDLEDDARPALEPLVMIGDVAVEGQTVTLGPRAAIVARRTRSGAALRRHRLVQLEGPLRRDADFGAVELAPMSRPTRIDFAITERCNLRCRHCITLAPERTKSGAARTLSPWLLDHLRDDLAAADYFGFVHGGESLTAPILFDVLHAIGAARGGFPYVAHLLTNGVLLGERETTRLLAAGVSSIAVSLDGASAATNDAVRTGGRFDLVVANMRDAVRARRQLGADLRIGISSVVMSTNVGELEALVDLAADIGVDWLKLEETVPVNAFASRSLLRRDDARGRDAIARAMVRGASRGLVMVDHTAPPTVWRCDLTDEARAFLVADQFANRSEIHPCRAAWEIACIEPNGDARLGDFFGAVMGNVAREPLEAMWRGPVARSERQRASGARLCKGGRPTCVTSGALSLAVALDATPQEVE
jgi:cyclomaltodextrinase